MLRNEIWNTTKSDIETVTVTQYTYIFLWDKNFEFILYFVIIEGQLIQPKCTGMSTRVQIPHGTAYIFHIEES